MNFLLDIIFLVILLTTVIRCTKRGFVKSIVNLVSLIASMVVAHLFTPRLAVWFEEKVFSGEITTRVSESIRALASRGGEIFDLSRLFADMPADFVSLLDRYGVDAEALRPDFGALESVSADAADRMAAAIAEPVVSGLASVCAYICIFLAALLACWLIGLLLDLLFKLPVLRTANRFFGFVLGLVCAGVLCWLFSEAAETLMGYLHSVDPSTFDADIIDNTLLVKYLCRTDLWLPQ